LTPAEDEEDEVDETEDEETKDEETAEAADEMLSVVENVALYGQMLMSSAEYQQLKQKGFYITSVTWISQQKYSPFNRVEFEAGFEHPKQGKGFRYNVRGIYRKRKSKYTKTRRPVDDDVKQSWFPIIERTAHQVLAELRKESEIGAHSSGAKTES
jgi:hypothetical protein